MDWNGCERWERADPGHWVNRCDSGALEEGAVSPFGPLRQYRSDDLDGWQQEHREPLLQGGGILRRSGLEGTVTLTRPSTGPIFADGGSTVRGTR
ncbi:hypothetical protein SAMN04487904_101398 [Actinopolyspora lacussalsi subsp. righensis]|uniref:Uncharacterized protein n=1 Tax=Actinopolyspora righensis TaxID=995060 RepID=A0A1I6XAQ1_9ACTN|nr:hypothetical protein SAMN04487904_101398 [Actinopolyspora righensis]